MTRIIQTGAATHQRGRPGAKLTTFIPVRIKRHGGRKVVIPGAAGDKVPEHDAPILMQNNAVEDRAECVDNLLEHGHMHEILIKPQIDARVLFIHRRKRGKDSDFIGDDILPDIRHLKL